MTIIIKVNMIIIITILMIMIKIIIMTILIVIMIKIIIILLFVVTFSHPNKPAGDVNSCVSVFLPKSTTYRLMLRVQGRACGKSIFKQFEVTIAKPTFKVFIQTDKYTYKPGQEVHFRIFAIEKVTLTVSKENVSIRSLLIKGIYFAVDDLRGL